MMTMAWRTRGGSRKEGDPIPDSRPMGMGSIRSSFDLKPWDSDSESAPFGNASGPLVDIRGIDMIS